MLAARTAPLRDFVSCLPTINSSFESEIKFLNELTFAIQKISVSKLDDLITELQKVKESEEKKDKIKFLGDLFMTILKDSPKVFSHKDFAKEVDAHLKEHDLTIGEVLSNFEPSYKEVFNNSLKEGSLFKLEVESDPKVELELWKITGVDQNLSMELIKSY